MRISEAETSISNILRKSPEHVDYPVVLEKCIELVSIHDYSEHYCDDIRSSIYNARKILEITKEQI